MTADISGIKFEDLNGNGIRDPGEEPLGGFIIYLDEAPFNGRLDAGERAVRTSADGVYLFRDVPPGTYMLNEVPRQGFASTNLPQSIVVPDDVGNLPTSTRIEIEKFLDINDNDALNENGFRDPGEPGVAGVTVFLDINVDGIRDINEPFAITDANGEAAFDDLPAGTYHVREELDQIYKPTTPDIFIVDLEPGEVETVVFGNAFKEGMIMGWKFRDDDENGLRNGDEPGLDGWTIELYEDDGDEMFEPPDITPSGTSDRLIETRITVDGFYMFEKVPMDAPEKTFFIREVLQPGFEQTNANVTDMPIVLPAAGSRTVNFGNVPVGGSISGRKFEDENRNGVQNGDEPGLAGWTIFLDTDRDGILNNAERSVVTAQNGDYTFTNLPPGTTYNVREVPQDDYIQTTNDPPPIALAAGENVTDVNFGNDDGSIRGIKFRDDNGNGVQDTGEPGLENWAIQLTDSAGNNISLRRTGSDGGYLFEDLGRGDYRVREVPQNGFRQTAPAGDGTFDITLAAGEDRTDVDFGNAPLGSISGEKYIDENRNGIKDTAEDVPNLARSGWTIYLDSNDNGMLDPEEVSDETDINGRYSFDDLLLGDYIVREVQQNGFEQTEPAPQDFAPVNLTINNPNATDVDFGNAEVLFASISGNKFRDDNRDGIQNDQEPGLENWTIQLIDTGGAVIDTTTTDANGDYSFTDIEAGEYTVREVLQDGFTPTAPTQNIPNQDSVTLEPGEVETVDFGNFIGGSISGVKFRDRNLPLPNGMRDPDEEMQDGLDGFTIYLDNDNNGELNENEEMHVTTEADGRYTFTDLAPGVYNIREVQQPNIEQTTMEVVEVILGPGENLREALPLDPDPTVRPVRVVEALAIGNRRDGEIIGEMFLDEDGDGRKDLGERGIEGIEVYLNREDPFQFDRDNQNPPPALDQNGKPILDIRDVSSETGGYNFPNLDAPLKESDTPETYKVSVLTATEQENIGTVNEPDRVFTATPRIGDPTDYYLTNDFSTNPDARTNDFVLEASFPDVSDPYIEADRNFGFIRVVESTEVNNLDESKAIRNFQVGTHVLGLPEDVTFGQLDFVDVGGNVEIQLPSEDDRLIAVLLGVESSAIEDASNFTPATSIDRPLIGEAFLDTNEDGTSDFTGETSGGNDSSVSGFVFLDVNGDGAPNPNGPQEMELQNTTVYLDSNSNSVLDDNESSTVTGSNGLYSFSNIDSSLPIRAIPRSSRFVQTTPDGQAATGEVNFGFARAIQSAIATQTASREAARGTVAGFLFMDANADGIQTSGEPGLKNSFVYVDINNNRLFDAGEPFDETNAKGLYAIDNVPSGNFTVRGVDNFVQTTLNTQINVMENVSRVSIGYNVEQLTGTADIANTFSLSANKTVVIDNFENGVDLLQLNNGLNFSDLIIAAGTGEGSNTSISYNNPVTNSDQVIAKLMGVQPEAIDRQDFIIS